MDNPSDDLTVLVAFTIPIGLRFFYLARARRLTVRRAVRTPNIAVGGDVYSSNNGVEK